MSYSLPSPFTGFYTKTYNTANSGSALLSALSGADIRSLEFDAATHDTPPVLTLSSLSTTRATAVVPTVSQWMQSAISTLPVQNNSGTSAINTFVGLGADTAEQADNYISLFNINTTSDNRILRFLLDTTVTNWTAGTSIGLSTTSATVNNVQIQTNGANALSSAALFTWGSSEAVFGSGGYCTSQPGTERVVLVTGNPSASTVQFNILQYSF
jgi:hypothetical protein